MLKLNNIDVSYGKIQALFGIALDVSEGSLVVILGNNGAGKSTTLLTISGILSPARGTIEFAGERIERVPPNHRVKLGLSLVPQNRQIFSGLTVRENLMMGAYIRRDYEEVNGDIHKVCQYFPVLGERQHQKGGTLSGGEQQMLAIARGLLSRPKLLLLDEPSVGLAPKLVDWIYQTIPRLHKEEGITILLVEQMAQLALQICDFAYMLQGGRILISGKPQQVLADEHIKAAYLGGR